MGTPAAAATEDDDARGADAGRVRLALWLATPFFTGAAAGSAT